jgi:multicomponent Na+:H+ antiporter subunit B
MNINLVIDIALLGLLVATAISIARTRDLFAAVMLTGIYGLLSASFFVDMDAVDVAFTEAAVGAGIAPLLMLVTLAMTGRYQQSTTGFSLPSAAAVVVVGMLLVFASYDMPAFGSPDAPAQQHVAPRYLQQSGDEIGIPNVVTSVLASYRGFDTLGEVVVIFTAGLAVLGILFSARNTVDPNAVASMRQHKVLRIVGKILIPPILIFALYVQFHGEYGPGGGFQAGVIFAAALILYCMLFGVRVAKQVINTAVVRVLAALGVLIYGCTGLVSLFRGGNYLDYSALIENPVTGQHIGIIVIEFGVGLTVASVMLLLYFSFAERSLLDGGDSWS